MNENGYAIVTGGSGGIGKAMCTKLAAMGYDIAITGTKVSEKMLAQAKELEETYKIRTGCYGCDVGDYESCRGMVEEIVAEMGRKVSVLVNNAGIGSGGPFLEAKPEEFQTVLSINLCSALNVTHLVLPYMVENHDGCIVHISSASALCGIDMAAIYCAAKGGILAMTKAMAKEFGRYHVRVNCIAPGPTMTPMLRDADPDLLRSCSLVGELGYAEDQAETLAYIVGAHNLTGQCLSSNGGMAM